MIFRALDSTGDWFFGSGKASYARYNNAIVFDIETKLKTFLGECFFDQRSGLPWFDLIVNKNKDIVVLYIKSAIISIYGVTKVKEIEYVVDDNRNMTITYTIDTLYESNMIGTVLI